MITNIDQHTTVNVSQQDLQRAESKIFNKYYRRIVAKYIKTLKNQFLAEDLALEVIEKILRKLSSYDEAYSMDAWVGRISTNHLIDYFRKNAANKNAVERQTGYGDYPSACYEQTIEPEFETADVMVELKKEIKKLPEQDQIIIKNIAFFNASYEEVGEALNLSVRTVKNRMNKIKAKMKDKIKVLTH